MEEQRSVRREKRITQGDDRGVHPSQRSKRRSLRSRWRDACARYFSRNTSHPTKFGESYSRSGNKVVRKPICLVIAGNNRQFKDWSWEQAAKNDLDKLFVWANYRSVHGLHLRGIDEIHFVGTWRKLKDLRELCFAIAGSCNADDPPWGYARLIERCLND